MTMLRNENILPIDTKDPYPQSSSPIIISHSWFVGLGLSLSDGGAVVTVSVDGVLNGDFADDVTMEGTGKWRWPNTDGVNRLYHASYVKITWNTGTLRVFQKS